MPRRAPEVIVKIPRFLVESVATRELRKAGEAFVRMVIREMKGHCFSISVHTRAMCRRVFPYKPRLMGPANGGWMSEVTTFAIEEDLTDPGDTGDPDV